MTADRWAWVGRARWWAGSYLIATTSLVGAIASLLTGETTTAICLFAVVVVASTGRIRARAEFRRGWRYGYASAIRTALELRAGRTSDLEVRATVHGDPTPEPWDEHVPPVLQGRAS